MNSMQRQNARILKEKLPRSVGARYATGDQWRNNCRKNEGMEPKQKQYPTVHVTGDRSKVRCHKAILHRNLEWQVHESRQIGSGQTRDGKSECRHSRNHELKWSVMGEFNSNDHYIYYCGQESLRRNGIAIMVNRRVQNAVLGCSLKNDRISLFISKENGIQYHSYPSLCPNQ